METGGTAGMSELELRLCEHSGSEYGVAVSGAATGLLLALKAVGIREGAGVLLAGLSYSATAELIRLAGGRPGFVDVNPSTYCIDPYSLENVLARHVRRRLPLPKAIIADDLFGVPADYGRLEEICGRYDILLIEDMGESFGAAQGGRKAGGFGRMAVGSFGPARDGDENSEGGIVFCHTEEDAARLRSLRRALDPAESAPAMIEASIAAEKLSAFERELSRRRSIAARYRERLAGFVRLQQVAEGTESAPTHFAIAMKSARLREGMIERLRLCHIPCTVFEPSPVLRQSEAPLERIALVNTRSAAGRILLLPMHPYLSRRVVDYICDRILEEVASPGTALLDLMAAGREELPAERRAALL